MEFKITKEFIIESHGAACSDWKKRIESEFPEAFPKGLEIGKWYKLENNPSYLLNFQSKDKVNNYGFLYWKWSNEWFFEDYHIGICQEATEEEISAALIAEAKKRGYKKGVKCNNSNVHNCEFENNILSTDEFYYDAISNELRVTVEPAVWYSIFKAGQWAKILPQEKTPEWSPAPTEKTVITREKALKILAKKLKVSPENIEIE